MSLAAQSRNTSTNSSALNQDEHRFDKNGKFKSYGDYRDARKSKLLRQVHDCVDQKSSIFHGLSFYVNGYTKPPALELRNLITTNGGEFHHFYSQGVTTYMVACNLSVSKWNTLRAGEKVIRSEWIMECIKAGLLLSDADYLLRRPDFSAKHGVENHAQHFGKQLIISNVTGIGLQMTRPIGCQQATTSYSLKYKNEQDVAQPSITQFLRVRKTPSPNICEQLLATKNNGNDITTKFSSHSTTVQPLVPQKLATKTIISKFSTAQKSGTTKKAKSSNRKNTKVERCKTHELTEAPHFSKELINASVGFNNERFRIGNVELDYMKAASEEDVHRLLTFFICLVEESHFYKLKTFFSFFCRTIFSLQNAHTDWLIVVTKIKSQINACSLKLFNLIVLD